MIRNADKAFQKAYAQGREAAGLDGDGSFIEYAGDTIYLDGDFTLQELRLIIAAFETTQRMEKQGGIPADPKPRRETWVCGCGTWNEIRPGETFPPFKCWKCRQEKP